MLRQRSRRWRGTTRDSGVRKSADFFLCTIMRRRRLTMDAKNTAPADEAVIGTEASELYLRIVSGGQQPDEAELPAAVHLLALGLLRQDPDGLYVAADPTLIGSRLSFGFQAEAVRQVALAAAVAAEFGPLGEAYAARPAGAAGMVEFLEGSAVINARLRPVLDGCTEELLVCQPGGERRKQILDTVKERDLETLGRGVRMRTIYHEDARAGAVMHGWVSEMTAAGAEYRTLAERFQRLIIIDRRVAVISGDTHERAYIVHDAGLASFLAAIFDRDWERGEPWFGGGEPRGHLDGQREKVLRKLATGVSNKVAAEDLGMGQRTLADLISELKVAYDAPSLFSLGAAWMAEQLSKAETVDDVRKLRRMHVITDRHSYNADGTRREPKSDGS